MKRLEEAWVKGMTEKDELEDRLEDVIGDIKVGKIGCKNCKIDKKGKGIEGANKNRPQKQVNILKEIQKREKSEIQMLPAPKMNDRNKASYKNKEDTFAEKAKTENPTGFTMVMGNKEKKRMTMLGKMEKTLLISERERRC